MVGESAVASELQHAPVGVRVDMSNPIHQTGLSRNIGFRDAAVVVLQEQRFNLHRTQVRHLVGCKFAARFWFWTSVRVRIRGISIIVGVLAMNVSETVLLIHRSIDNDQS